MPENRHFWQGVDVAWRGDVYDLMANPHGSIIYFTDYRCGVSVELDSDAVPNLYSATDNWSDHFAVAQFEVNGRLSYKGGKVVLRPDRLKQTSPWQSDEDFDAYIAERYAVQLKGVR